MNRESELIKDLNLRDHRCLELESKVKSFLNLEDGWGLDKGKAFEPMVISLSYYFLKIISVLSRNPVNVFPCVDGSVVVCVYGSDKELELEIKEDLSIEVTVDTEDDAFVMENMDVDYALSMVNAFVITYG